MSDCVTHHFACSCREAAHAAEVDRLTVERESFERMAGGGMKGMKVAAAQRDAAEAELVEARKVIDAARNALDQLGKFLDFLGEAGRADAPERERELLGLLSGNGHPEERVFRAADDLHVGLARWDTLQAIRYVTTADQEPRP